MSELVKYEVFETKIDYLSWIRVCTFLTALTAIKIIADDQRGCMFNSIQSIYAYTRK